MTSGTVPARLVHALFDDDEETTCPGCGQEADELRLSDVLGGRCCADCHFRASAATRSPQERAQTRAAIRRHEAATRRYRPPAPSPDPPYAVFVRGVWRAIERVTGAPPVYLDRDRVGGDCPVGCGGTLAIQFLDNPPRMRFESTRGEDACSSGCPAARIYEALR